MLDVEATVQQYMPYAISHARKAANSYHLDYDDCLQEILFGIMLSVQYFDETRGYFFTYMKRVVAGRIWAWSRHEMTNSFPVEFRDPEDGYELGVIPERWIIYKEEGYDAFESQTDFIDFLKTLSENEQLMIDLYIADVHQSDIARLLSISKPTVSRALKSIRKRYAEEYRNAP